MIGLLGIGSGDRIDDSSIDPEERHGYFCAFVFSLARRLASSLGGRRRRSRFDEEWTCV
jgi:hypothetical protein